MQTLTIIFTVNLQIILYVNTIVYDTLINKKRIFANVAREGSSLHLDCASTRSDFASEFITL